jgi:hypothetical protein
LANLYMRRFILGWKALGHEKRFQARIVNYADDFVICCRKDAELAATVMRNMMARLKLTINEDKTRICHSPQEQTRRGIHLQFVKENLTFTGEDSPMANLMLSVLGAVAQFERELIKERQREGIALAKERGAYRGRKKALPEEKAADLRRRASAGEKKAPLAREFGISRETLYQYLRQKPGLS